MKLLLPLTAATAALAKPPTWGGEDEALARFTGMPEANGDLMTTQKNKRREALLDAIQNDPSFATCVNRAQNHQPNGYLESVKSANSQNALNYVDKVLAVAFHQEQGKGGNPVSLVESKTSESKTAAANPPYVTGKYSGFDAESYLGLTVDGKSFHTGTLTHTMGLSTLLAQYNMCVENAFRSDNLFSQVVDLSFSDVPFYYFLRFAAVQPKLPAIGGGQSDPAAAENQLFTTLMGFAGTSGSDTMCYYTKDGSTTVGDLPALTTAISKSKVTAISNCVKITVDAAVEHYCTDVKLVNGTALQGSQVNADRKSVV